MTAVTAPRVTRAKNAKRVPAPGTIEIPAHCKVSRACEPTGTRPVIQHAYLRARGKSVWLCATDSYIAAAVEVRFEGDLIDGWVPIGALRLMERGQKGEQLGEKAWRVHTQEGIQTFDVSDRLSGSVDYPSFESLGVFDGPTGEQETVQRIGVNAKLMERLGAALGARHGLRFEFYGELRPIRVLPLSHTGRVGLQMPIRLS